MNYNLLAISAADRVLTVTLNRPEKGNALSTALGEEIIALCGELRSDVETRAVVFTGAGRHFCAGMDLSVIQERAKPGLTLHAKSRMAQMGPRLIRAVREIEQVTIAAINGGAVGGGACIATACDFRIGTPSSWVSYPEINLGMNLSWRALPLCVQLVGPARAKRMVMLGNKERAEDLLAWGFLDEIAAEDALLDRASVIAADYAARPPMQTQMIKRSINVLADAGADAIMHMDGDQFMLASLTKDHMEGVRAALSKTKPEFKGE